MNAHTTSRMTIWGSRLATGTVAAVAGYASYQHITHVALAAGEAVTVAHVYPLAIDGLIVVGTLAMLADKASGRYPRLSARLAVGFGIAATLAANVASAQPTTMARLVAAVPAVAFLLAVEVLARSGRLRPAEAPAGPAGERPGRQGSTAPQGPPTVNDHTASVIAQPVRPDTPAVRRTRPVSAPPATAAVPSTAQQVARLTAREPDLTAKQVAERLGISDRTARRYMPKVSDPARTDDRDGSHVEQPEPALV